MHSLKKNSLKEFFQSQLAYIFGGVIGGLFIRLFSPEMSIPEIVEMVITINVCMASIYAYSWYCEQKGKPAVWGKMVVFIIAIILTTSIYKGLL